MDKVTTQEIRFLQVNGFFKPFGQHREKVFYFALPEDQQKIVDGLLEKRILEVSMNEVRPWAMSSSAWSYCYNCPSKSQSGLLMTIHARNSEHMTTVVPKPASRYMEIRTP